MLDELRKGTEDDSLDFDFENEDNVITSDDREQKVERLFLGMTAVERMFISIFLFMNVCVLGLAFLTPLTAAAQWAGTRVDDADGVLALAAFSTLFKLAGVLVFYPWLDRYAGFIERITGAGSDSALSRLEPAVAAAGGSVALEAAWRATLELARKAVDAVCARLGGQAVVHAPQGPAIEQVEGFLEALSLDTIDPRLSEPRLVRLCHALDHLAGLERALAFMPPAGGEPAPPGASQAAAQALAAWLEARLDPAVAPQAPILPAIEAAAARLAQERRRARRTLLEDVALQRVPAAAARARLEELGWADGALAHASRLVASLEEAAGA